MQDPLAHILVMEGSGIDFGSSEGADSMLLGVGPLSDQGHRG